MTINMQDSGAMRRVLVAVPSNVLILTGFCLFAAAVLGTPLQHFIPLSRYQHYGIAIFVFGLGYLVQGIASWPGIRILGKCGYLATSVFFCSAGLVFINNPWLDLRVCADGDAPVILRNYFIGAYGVAGFLISFVWLTLALQELKRHYRRDNT